MLAFLTALCGAIAAMFNYLTKSIVGLAATIYKDYYSPKAKKQRKADKDFEEANKKGDVGGLY